MFLRTAARSIVAATGNAARNLSSSASTPAAKAPAKTPLYDIHVKHRAKMVDFCGWSMPVQYDIGILASVHHVRSQCGLFDVSHMGQLRITGKDRVKFIESLCVGDIAELSNGSARLSVLTNEQGGIKDDCMITQYPNHLYMVINAGCFDKDMAHINEHVRSTPLDVKIEVLTDRALVALQGPKAHTVLQRYVSADLSKMAFMTGQEVKIDGSDCIVTRCGYTGEDGFEISIPTSNCVAITERFLSEVEVAPAGLGARDALRLEAGLCLYGNDLNETTTPVEAGLTWTIGKRRRAEGGFLGSDVILAQLKSGVARKRVGLRVEGAPARDHSAVYDVTGNKVGEITSGAFSPILKAAVAQAYVATASSKIGTELLVEVRNKKQKAVVSKMPFVPNTYYRIPE